MGSTTGRQGSQPNKTLERTLPSIFICGSSSTLPNEMDDDLMEDYHDPGNPTKFQRPIKEPSGTEHSSISPKGKYEVFLDSNVIVTDNLSPETVATTSIDFRRDDGASTSNQERVLLHPNSLKGRVVMSFVEENDDIVERIALSDRSSQMIENGISSESINDTCEEAVPSTRGSSVPESEQEQRNETIQHDDMMSISSDNLSMEIDTHELRLDTRRLIGDAYLLENSGRHSDPQTFTFSSDDSDDELLDIQYLGSQTHSINEHQQRSWPEIWESIRRGSDVSHLRTSRCPSGLHSYDTCFCDPTLMAEDGSPRASLSRIIMLAETLFELLDEIQRHPLSLPLATFSLPAPVSVVDTLPVKIHKEKCMSESDHIEQCQICLAEYEEGDEIRVLPCHHEYHMSCVDKWLKEVHGVCPLCRGDVCVAEVTVLSSEIPRT